MNILDKKSSIILIYIFIIDFCLIIFNTIYHFIKHGFYKTIPGIIFIIFTIIVSDIIFISIKSDKDDIQIITKFLLSLLGIVLTIFFLLVAILSFIVTCKTPWVLLIEYIILFIIIIWFTTLLDN